MAFTTFSLVLAAVAAAEEIRLFVRIHAAIDRGGTMEFPLRQCRIQLADACGYLMLFLSILAFRDFGVTAWQTWTLVVLLLLITFGAYGSRKSSLAISPSHSVVTIRRWPMIRRLQLSSDFRIGLDSPDGLNDKEISLYLFDSQNNRVACIDDYSGKSEIVMQLLSLGVAKSKTADAGSIWTRFERVAAFIFSIVGIAACLVASRN